MILFIYVCIQCWVTLILEPMLFLVWILLATKKLKQYHVYVTIPCLDGHPRAYL